MTKQDEDYGGSDDEKITREAKRRFKQVREHESNARDNADRDVRFANGDAYNQWQWTDGVIQSRGDRPCLTQNKTRIHNRMIVNDALQNKAQVKVSPTGGGATYEAAQIFSGCIKRIEYQSKAIDAYSTAIYHQVESGVGYVRVDLDYVDENSWDQDIFIRRIADWKSVYIDPDAQQYDKSDMRWAFVFRDLARDVYDAEFPKEEDERYSAPLDNSDGWDDRDHVRVAEYWRRTDKSDKLHRMDDGSVFRESDIPKDHLKAIKPRITDSRDVSRTEVEWFKIAGSKIIDRRQWLGKYIPIVPFIGEEFVVDGKFDRKGHTRAMIDDQRMLNYWNSAAVEYVALQTKSPWIAREDAVMDHMNDWEDANTQNKALLLYKGIDEFGQPIPRPERTEPPVMASAFLEGMKIARENMEMVTGQFEATFGQPSNERSGVAIQQRQRAGDRATYHFIDNQAKAIRQVGRVCLDLIPKVYDVARVTKIMAQDDAQSDVHIDPQAPTAQQHVAMMPHPTVPNGPPQPTPITPDQASQMADTPDAPDVRVIFNPTIGIYDVEADVGPSFATKRQEQFNALSQIMQTNKEAMQIGGDLLWAAADFPSSDQLEKRWKNMLPPQALGGPPQQVIDLQKHIAELSQENQQLQMAAKNQGMRQEDRAADVQRKDYEAETKRLEVVGGIDPDALKLLIREMVSQMISMPALPAMAAHADAESNMPVPGQNVPPPPMANGAGPGQGAPMQ